MRPPAVPLVLEALHRQNGQGYCECIILKEVAVNIGFDSIFMRFYEYLCDSLMPDAMIMV